ncbi:MAG: TauD/TfdA family dioxygenase [Acidobacteriota bacterium]
MTNPRSVPPPTLPGIGAVRRRAVASPSAAVTCEPLAGGSPVVVTPAAGADLDLEAWAAGERESVDRWFAEHRALLFRGFRVDGLEAFRSFAGATADGDPLDYRDRSTPRPELGRGVYVSTVYPPARSIDLHNEGTYWVRFPLKIYFGSLIVADEGGETPIADVRRVLARLPETVRERFRRLGVLYVRNYNDGFGLPWQEVFQTESREEVEDYCRGNAIELEWKAGDRLRTRQHRPAIRRHPVTDEEIWFNHALFFHTSSLDSEMRRTLLADLGEEGLPYATYYGDGSPIEPEVTAAIRQAYEQETIAFPWQTGDVLMLDNLCFAHGRRPYRGERQVVVAMMEPVAG